jgi:metal-responsive CopG/Arc/MetJ family transcriptional regulator
VTRVLIAFRIAPAALALIDGYAAEEQVGRSEMIRRLLSEAVQARQRRKR